MSQKYYTGRDPGSAAEEDDGSRSERVRREGLMALHEIVTRQEFDAFRREQLERDRRQSRIERTLIVVGAIFDAMVVVLAVQAWI